MILRAILKIKVILKAMFIFGSSDLSFCEFLNHEPAELDILDENWRHDVAMEEFAILVDRERKEVERVPTIVPS